MYIKPRGLYLEHGKTFLAKAWGGAKHLLGNIDYALGTAQRIGNVAAPQVAEAMGDRGGSVKEKVDAARIQMNRTKEIVGGARAAHSRISDVILQIT